MYNSKGKRWVSLQRKNAIILSILLLIPVMIVSAANFSILYARNISTIESDLNIESEQKLELMRTQLVAMYRLVSQQRLNKDFSTHNLKESNEYEMYFTITRSLREPVVWTSFFSSINYYNQEVGLVYSPSTVKSAEDFFGKSKMSSELPDPYRGPSLEFQTDLISLQQPGNHVRSMRVRNVDGGDGVLLAMPLELKSDAPPASYLLFTVSDKTLSSIWGAKNGITSLVKYNDVPIYSSDKVVRQSIYEGKDVNGELISGGELSYSYMQDGISVQWIVEKKLIMESQLQTILLETIVTFSVMSVSLTLVLYFSRKSYEPIQKIIQRLPLPTHYAQERVIDEFKYINFVLDDLIYSKQHLEEASKELRREKYLYTILVNEIGADSPLFTQCLSEGIRVDRHWYACLVIDDTEENHDLFIKLSSNEEKAITETDFYSIYIEENKYLFLIASDLPKQQLEEWLSHVRSNDYANVGVSSIVEGVNNVRSAYESVSFSKDESPSSSELSSKYPMLELLALQESVEADNYDKLEFSLNMIKQSMRGSNETMRGAILMAVCTILCRGDLRKTKKMIGEIKNTDAASVGTVVESWKNSLQEEVESVSVGRKLPRNLRNILRYIEENYTSPNFSIKYMAAEFGTSPSNLSHQFKKATGQTLSCVIDEMRIQRAEKLLIEGEQVSVVAQKLGYSTTPVFTEKFKRLRGITPSVYRNSYQFHNKEPQ